MVRSGLLHNFTAREAFMKYRREDPHTCCSDRPSRRYRLARALPVLRGGIADMYF